MPKQKGYQFNWDTVYIRDRLYDVCHILDRRDANSVIIFSCCHLASVDCVKCCDDSGAVAHGGIRCLDYGTVHVCKWRTTSCMIERVKEPVMRLGGRRESGCAFLLTPWIIDRPRGFDGSMSATIAHRFLLSHQHRTTQNKLHITNVGHLIPFVDKSAHSGVVYGRTPQSHEKTHITWLTAIDTPPSLNLIPPYLFMSPLSLSLSLSLSLFLSLSFSEYLPLYCGNYYTIRNDPKLAQHHDYSYRKGDMHK